MRELSECTAEVFRRGEQRIKERRRKRNRVLALCVPACLIAAAWSLLSSPAMTPAMGTSGYAQAAEEILGIAEMSRVCPYTAVEIQDSGLLWGEHDGKVTDRLAVAEMFQAIHSLFSDVDVSDRNVSDNTPAANDNAIYGADESTSGRKGCTITFTDEEGLQAVYRLSEHTLVNVSANETILLSEAQVAGLLAVFSTSE